MYIYIHILSIRTLPSRGCEVEWRRKADIPKMAARWCPATPSRVFSPLPPAPLRRALGEETGITSPNFESTGAARMRSVRHVSTVRARSARNSSAVRTTITRNISTVRMRSLRNNSTLRTSSLRNNSAVRTRSARNTSTARATFSEKCQHSKSEFRTDCLGLDWVVGVPVTTTRLPATMVQSKLPALDIPLPPSECPSSTTRRSQ